MRATSPRTSAWGRARARRGSVVAVLTALLATAACEEADLACPDGHAVAAGGVRYCVYRGDAASGRDCTAELPHRVALAGGLVCSSSAREPEDLPPQVCALLATGCAASPLDDAGTPPDAGAATLDAHAGDASDAGDAPDAPRDTGAGPRDATAGDGSADAGTPDVDLGPDDAGPVECASLTVQAVSCGAGHVCAIALGRLYCWGENDHGQVGLDSGGAYVARPARIGADLDWQRVSAGDTHTCAIRTDGTLWCWGEGADGRLGLPPDRDYLEPARVGGRSDWIRIAAGGRHTCGVEQDDTAFVRRQLRCWGANDSGQLGSGDYTPVTTTTGPAIGATGMVIGFQDVDCGAAHTCGRTTSGELYCWGANDSGQLGDRTGGPGLSRPDHGAPIRFADWNQVELGDAHTCGRNATGLLRCWGAGSEGRLGQGADETDHTSAVALDAIAQRGLAVGGRHTCALDWEGAAACFGSNASGQLGVGPGGGPSLSTPTAVATDLRFELVAAGGRHTCAVSEGTLYCWGLAGPSVPAAGEDADPTVPSPPCFALR